MLDALSRLVRTTFKGSNFIVNIIADFVMQIFLWFNFSNLNFGCFSFSGWWIILELFQWKIQLNVLKLCWHTTSVKTCKSVSKLHQNTMNNWQQLPLLKSLNLSRVLKAYSTSLDQLSTFHKKLMFTSSIFKWVSKLNQIVL